MNSNDELLFYRHLLKLTGEIGVKLNEDNITAVNILLGQREEIINKIKEISPGLDHSVIEVELNELKQRLFNENNVITKQFEKKFSAVKEQLRNFNEMTHLRKAYNTNFINEDGIFFDKNE